MGFGQGLSGLNAAAQNLDVIGNNIANSGTVGFKSATASFADVYASSRVGLGVKVSGINQRFTVGAVTGGGGEGGGLTRTRRGLEKTLFQITIGLGFAFLLVAILAVIYSS